MSLWNNSVKEHFAKTLTARLENDNVGDRIKSTEITEHIIESLKTVSEETLSKRSKK